MESMTAVEQNAMTLVVLDGCGAEDNGFWSRTAVKQKITYEGDVG